MGVGDRVGVGYWDMNRWARHVATEGKEGIDGSWADVWALGVVNADGF